MATNGTISKLLLIAVSVLSGIVATSGVSALLGTRAANQVERRMDAKLSVHIEAENFINNLILKELEKIQEELRDR